MTAAEIRQQLANIAVDARNALGHIELALHVAAWLEHDYRDPGERAAVALVTHTGRVAELWQALCAELGDASDTLDIVQTDIEKLEERLDQDEATDLGDEPILGDKLDLAGASPVPPPVETPKLATTNAVRAWDEKQRRGNGAAPSAASISPVEDRQPSENQETLNHGTSSRMD